MTDTEWCQLYRLLDKMPTEGLEQSYVNNINDVWELVREKLISLDIDPDENIVAVVKGNGGTFTFHAEEKS